MTCADTLVCATIKWGTRYPTEHVNKLFRAVQRNTDRKLRFICMTETPDGLQNGIEWIPLKDQPFEAEMLDEQTKSRHKKGALRKVSIFNPEIFGNWNGPVLVLDIDILIAGNLDEIADFAPGKVAMRRTFNNNPMPFSYGHGSIIKFEPSLHGYLYKYMSENPRAAVQMSDGSEQSYTSISAVQKDHFAYLPDEWIVSFKKHCRPRKPLNLFKTPKCPEQAKVICFHGRPDIHEAAHGFTGRIFDKVLPTPWISDMWQ